MAETSALKIKWKSGKKPIKFGEAGDGRLRAVSGMKERARERERERWGILGGVFYLFFKHNG
jgi:hypothetical protein